jgi:hypothetical protein
MTLRRRTTASLLLALVGVCAPLGPARAGSLLFDGFDDSIVVSDPIELTGALTIEAWIKVQSATGGGRIVSNRNGANGYEFNLWDSGGGEAAELWFSMNGNLLILSPFSRARFNSWTHVAVTYEGPPLGTMKLYIDGVEVASSLRDEVPNPTTGPFRMGAIGLGDNFFFHGSMDEVRVFDTVLSAAVIEEWHNRVADGAHPAFGALKGYWRFEEGSGQSTASEVNSPTLDATLGLAAGADASDPEWSADSAVPVVRATFSSIKAGLGRPRR